MWVVTWRHEAVGKPVVLVLTIKLMLADLNLIVVDFLEYCFVVHVSGLDAGTWS